MKKHDEKIQVLGTEYKIFFKDEENEPRLKENWGFCDFVAKDFLKDTKGGVGVNLDPANFTMVTGQDAKEAVYILRDYIVHTHAKDGVMLDPEQDPTEVYHAFATGGVEALNACSGFEERPLGSGEVDWDGYLLALKDIGYDGFLTIERECGSDPAGDIACAAEFLKGKLRALKI